MLATKRVESHIDCKGLLIDDFCSFFKALIIIYQNGCKDDLLNDKYNENSFTHRPQTLGTGNATSLHEVFVNLIECYA